MGKRYAIRKITLVIIITIIIIIIKNKQTKKKSVDEILPDMGNSLIIYEFVE